MSVTVESASVFRAAGRRWFTKRAALRAEARALIKTYCDCDPPDPPHYPGLACMYHRDPELHGDLLGALASALANAEATMELLDVHFCMLHEARFPVSRSAPPLTGTPNE